MPKNLRYDNSNACCVPYDSPPNEWLSVEEKLPVEAKKVLCVLALSGGPMVETGYYMGDEGWYYTGIEAPHHGVVTHWMPLPEPPGRNERKRGDDAG